MNPKEYYISTIEQIRDVVTPENIDVFMTDLRNYILVTGEMRKISSIKEKNPGVFHWIDDGKNDARLNISIKP